MARFFWRVVRRSRYRDDMAQPSSGPDPVTPERRLPALDQWMGMWVAVKDGKVIAAAHNSRDLVPKLQEMGEAGRGAVAQYVPYPSDSIVIGVG